MSTDAPPTGSDEDRLAELLRHVRSGDDETESDDDGVPPGRHRPARVPLLSVPASMRSVDLAVAPRAVRGLLLVALVVVVVLVGRWAWAELGAAPVAAETVRLGTEADGQAGSGSGGPAGGPADGSADGSVRSGAMASGATTTPGPDGPGRTARQEEADPAATPSGAPAGTPRVLVHVAGAVGKPGVVELTPGARVVDAIEAGGGLTPEADPSALNLARPVVDGERVWVGRPGEEPPPAAHPAGLTSPAGGQAAVPGTGAPPPAELVDLNTADQARLEELPGVGPVTAGHILAWREAHGRFTRVDELLEVSGIGERTFERLEPLVTVGG